MEKKILLTHKNGKTITFDEYNQSEMVMIEKKKVYLSRKTKVDK
jgi:hypothetical protein